MRVPVPNPKPEENSVMAVCGASKDRPILTEIECTGNSSYDRICKMKNICYSPNSDRFSRFQLMKRIEALMDERWR